MLRIQVGGKMIVNFVNCFKSQFNDRNQKGAIEQSSLIVLSFRFIPACMQQRQTDRQKERKKRETNHQVEKDCNGREKDLRDRNRKREIITGRRHCYENHFYGSEKRTKKQKERNTEGPLYRFRVEFFQKQNKQKRNKK